MCWAWCSSFGAELWVIWGAGYVSVFHQEEKCKPCSGKFLLCTFQHELCQFADRKEMSEQSPPLLFLLIKNLEDYSHTLGWIRTVLDKITTFQCWKLVCFLIKLEDFWNGNFISCIFLCFIFAAVQNPDKRYNVLCFKLLWTVLLDSSRLKTNIWGPNVTWDLGKWCLGVHFTPLMY